ncbi:hypothetical protein [Sunxiuqinia dokdonensis]|nr:hypothetical protein [Sunxiuqinia dokdonensis]
MEGIRMAGLVKCGVLEGIVTFQLPASPLTDHSNFIFKFNRSLFGQWIDPEVIMSKNQYMERVTLFKMDNPDIKISMEIYFNEQDQLIFDGYDIGKRVEDCWGDSDYEYTYTIEPNEVQKLFALLEVPNFNKHALLLEIKKRFGGNSAYSRFGDFMSANNIDFTGFTWT